MTLEMEVMALRAQLRLTGAMLGQMWGLFQRTGIVVSEETETFFGNFSTDNGINTEFMNEFRLGLDKMIGPTLDS